MIKITEKYHCSDDWEMRESLEIEVYAEGLGQECMSFYDGEPEDNSMGRNFADVHSITEALKLAYKAGKEGLELKFEYIEEEAE